MIQAIVFLPLLGAILAGLMEYSEHHPIGFVAPFIGAVILLALYAVTASRQPAEHARHDEFRRAA